MTVENCGKALLLQAEFDHELTAAESVELADHRARCETCRERWAELTATREELSGATRYSAGPQLLRAVARNRGSAGSGAARSRRVSWREAASFSAGAAVAALIVSAVLPVRSPGVVAALVDDHVRALQPGHLTDVVSTDKHTVKPWFDGKLDFSPPVKNLAADGFPLIGGRLDYLRGHPVAALVYSRGRHVIDLFVWPDSFGIDVPGGGERDGYRIVHWTSQGMALTAVSDVAPDALRSFVHEWQRSP